MRAAGWLRPILVLMALGVCIGASVLMNINDAAVSAPQSPLHFRRHATPPACPELSREAIAVEAIRKACIRYGIEGDTAKLICLAWKESRLDCNARNDKSGTAGLFQFKQWTFKEMAWKAGKPGACIFSAEDSADIAAWAWAHDQGRLWAATLRSRHD